MNSQKNTKLELGDTKTVGVVDTDTHPDTFIDVMIDDVPEPWRSMYYKNRPHDVENGRFFYAPPTSARIDATITGKRPGEDKALYAEQVLQETDTDYAVLLPLSRGKWWDPEWESAKSSATNTYIAREWLSTENNWHGRYLSGIRVSPGDPDRAVAEIRKWAGHPYFCQVQFAPEVLTAPAGHPMYRAVFREAAAQGLPVAMHITRETSMQSMTPVGYSSYHIEAMGSWGMYYAAHLASLIFDGVFSELPELKVVFVEGGFTWAAPLLWRLDKYWAELGSEVPHVKRKPSEYARDQLRITTQPLEEPKDPRDLVRIIEAMNGQDILMFSSDYPHWDYDDPRHVASRLPAEWRDKVMFQNACDLYGLPATRPVDALDLEADSMTRYRHQAPATQHMDSYGQLITTAKSAASFDDFVAAD